MDIAEFVEKVCGIKLLQYQKEMIQSFANLPEGSCIVMGRKGPILLDKNGERITKLQQTYILK